MNNFNFVGRLFGFLARIYSGFGGKVLVGWQKNRVVPSSFDESSCPAHLVIRLKNHVVVQGSGVNFVFYFVHLLWYEEMQGGRAR